MYKKIDKYMGNYDLSKPNHPITITVVLVFIIGSLLWFNDTTNTAAYTIGDQYAKPAKADFNNPFVDSIDVDALATILDVKDGYCKYTVETTVGTCTSELDSTVTRTGHVISYRMKRIYDTIPNIDTLSGRCSYVFFSRIYQKIDSNQAKKIRINTDIGGLYFNR
jgi:hypothetical protein